MAAGAERRRRDREWVVTPTDVVNKIEALKKDGKQSADLLVVSRAGNQRNVTLRFP
jgi:hypothetical protein